MVNLAEERAIALFFSYRSMMVGVLDVAQANFKNGVRNVRGILSQPNIELLSHGFAPNDPIAPHKLVGVSCSDVSDAIFKVQYCYVEVASSLVLVACKTAVDASRLRQGKSIVTLF